MWLKNYGQEYQETDFKDPELVHGKSFNAFSSFGIAAMMLFAFIYYWNWRGRDE